MNIFNYKEFILVFVLVLFIAFFSYKKGIWIATTLIMIFSFLIYKFYSIVHEQGMPVFNDEKIYVLSTVGYIHDIVKYIVEDYIVADLLIPLNSEPHGYEMLKGDSDKFNRSKLMFFSGLNLESSMSVKKAISNHMNAVDISNEAFTKNPDKKIFHHGTPDPHIWLDLEIIYNIIDPIVTNLIVIDQKNSSFFAKRGSELKQRIADLHKRLTDQMNKIPIDRKFLVTSHKGYSYFVQGYFGVDKDKIQDHADAIIGMTSFSDVNIIDIKRIGDFILDKDIKVIFPEYGVSQKGLLLVKEYVMSKGYDVKISSREMTSDSVDFSKINDFETFAEYIVRNNVECFVEANIE